MSMLRSPAAELWEATEKVLAAGPNPYDILREGASALRVMLGADRADVGIVASTTAGYEPTFVDIRSADYALPEFHVPASDAFLAHVLASPVAVGIVDVEASLAPGPSRQFLLEHRTRSLVIRRIDRGDGRCGLVCLDWVDPASLYRDDGSELIDLFVSRVLSRVLGMALAQPRRWNGSALARLSASERDVAVLAAEGLSYDQIARRLGKSAHTVDHQLLRARRALGARNTAHLVELISGQPH